MHKAMSLSFKLLSGLFATIVILGVGVPSAISYYDSRTTKALLREATQELPPRASNKEMLEFMQRHTARYALDDEFNHEYAGIVAQTSLDKALFDRKVQIVLKLNSDRTFKRAEVRIFYTGL